MVGAVWIWSETPNASAFFDTQVLPVLREAERERDMTMRRVILLHGVQVTMQYIQQVSGGQMDDIAVMVALYKMMGEEP